MASLKGRLHLSPRPQSPKPPPPPQPQIQRLPVGAPTLRPAPSNDIPSTSPPLFQSTDDASQDPQQGYITQWHTRIHSHAEASTSYPAPPQHWRVSRSSMQRRTPGSSSLPPLASRSVAVSSQQIGPAAVVSPYAATMAGVGPARSQPLPAASPSAIEPGQQQQQQSPGSLSTDLVDFTFVGRASALQPQQQQSLGPASDWGTPEEAADAAAAPGGIQQHAVPTSSSSGLLGHGASNHSSGAAGATAAEQLVRGRGSNFQDPGLEMGISSWVLQAPDWFTVRTLYLRWQQRLNVVHLAVMLHQLARLTLHQHRVMLSEEREAFELFLEQLARHVQQRALSLDGRTAVSVLHSLAHLVRHQQQPKHAASLIGISSELLPAVLEHLQPHLARLQPKQLCTLIWSLGVLQAAPSDAWQGELLQVVQRQLPGLNDDSLAVLLYGFSGMQVSLSSKVLDALLLQVEPLLSTLRLQQLSMVVAALGRLRHKPSMSFMESLTSSLRERMPTLDPPLLTNIIWSLSRLGYVPGRSWLMQFYSVSNVMLDTYTPAELSVSVWSMSQQQLQPTDTWLDEFFDQSEAKWRSYSLRDLALTGYSLARLDLRPPRSWLRRYCGAILQRDQQQQQQQGSDLQQQQQQVRRQQWLSPSCMRQLLVALAAFKVPNLDGWRQELYAAAGMQTSKMPAYKRRLARERQAAAAAADAAKRAKGTSPVPGALKIVPLPPWEPSSSSSSSSSGAAGTPGGSGDDGPGSSEAASDGVTQGSGSLGFSSVSSYDEPPAAELRAAYQQQRRQQDGGQQQARRQQQQQPLADNSGTQQQAVDLTQGVTTQSESALLVTVAAAAGISGQQSQQQGLGLSPSSGSVASGVAQQPQQVLSVLQLQQLQAQDSPPMQQQQQQQQGRQQLFGRGVARPVPGVQLQQPGAAQQLSSAATAGVL